MYHSPLSLKRAIEGHSKVVCCNVPAVFELEAYHIYVDCVYRVSSNSFSFQRSSTNGRMALLTAHVVDRHPKPNATNLTPP